MPVYRVRSLAPGGRHSAAELLLAPDDGVAIQLLQLRSEATDSELRTGARLVAIIPARESGAAALS